MAGFLYCLPLTSPWLQCDDSSLHARLQLLNDNKSPLVLFGNENCGKTVLLFQAAIAYASKDYHVTCISRTPLTRMPLSIHGMTRPDSAGQLKTLTFMYMNKVGDLIEFCARLHSKSLTPDVIIIDDLQYYIDQMTEPTPEAGCSRLCAILQDTACYIQSKSAIGVTMFGCRNIQSYVPQIMKQFKFACAHITATSTNDSSYNIDFQEKHVTLNLNYQIRNSGMFMQDISMTTLKSS